MKIVAIKPTTPVSFSKATDSLILDKGVKNVKTAKFSYLITCLEKDGGDVEILVLVEHKKKVMYEKELQAKDMKTAIDLMFDVANSFDSHKKDMLSLSGKSGKVLSKKYDLWVKGGDTSRPATLTKTRKTVK